MTSVGFYNDIRMSGVYEIPNGAAQGDLIVGEWLLIPDLANPGHHTVAAGETLEVPAERWYGEKQLFHQRPRFHQGRQLIYFPSFELGG